MKRILAIFAVLSSSLLCGCVTWTKPGTSQQDYFRQKYQCDREAAQIEAAQGVLANSIDEASHFFDCMMASGWTPQR